MINILPIKYRYLLSSIFIAALLFLIPFNVSGQTTVEFLASDSWTVPDGVTSITVECWGAGGGGGTNNIGGGGAGSGGGGGGAYARSVILVSPGNNFSIVVGTGGSAGNDGGNSTFDGATVVAAGGKGVVLNDPNGGLGGQASGSTGDTRNSGGNGATVSAKIGGGGGGAAGFTGAGGNGGTPTGGLGITPNGGDGGDGGSNAAGGNGLLYGGGGGGAGRANSGGSGADGYVTITYTPVASNCPASTDVTPIGAQTLCQGDASNQLTANINMSGGTGFPPLLYQWYYNTTNTNTIDGSTITIAGATNSTYTPLTTASEEGVRYYFCVGYATDNNCNQTSLTGPASNTILVTVNALPAAPTGTASQTFCTIDNPTVANLTATGTSIQWYDAPSGGSLIAGSTPLVDGNHYYATQTVAGCESDLRFDVTVTISDPAAPAGTASQTFCAIDNPTVASLTATGTLIQWYDAPSGGSLLAGSTGLIDGNHYYATQTVAGCESDTRFDVTVTISDPAAPTGTASQTFCTNDNPTVASLTATGTSIQWYDAPTGGSLLAGSTALVDGNNYYATQTVAGCESDTRFDVTVTVKTVPDLPVIEGATTVTTGNNYTYNITPVGDATNYTWTYPGTWTYVSGGDGFATLEVTAGSLGGDITVIVTNSCGNGPMATLTATIGVAPDCPTSTAVGPGTTQILCQGDLANELTAIITTAGSPTLKYEWYYNATNSNNPVGAVAVGATTDKYTPLTTATEVGDRWYFCVGYADDAGCTQTNLTGPASNAVQVSVSGTTTPSDAGSPQTISDGSGANLSANAPTNGTGAWSVFSGPSSNTSQFSSLSNPFATFTPDGGIGDYVLTWTISNSPCTASSTNVTITVSNASLPPTISLGSNPTVCQGITTANLSYSSTTDSPDKYSIDYFVASESEGFEDVTDADLLASPIALFVPDAPAPAVGIYYANLTVKNSTSGLVSGIYSISVTVISTPATPSFIFGSTTVPESTSGLSYSIVGIPGATSYTWSVPTGWTIEPDPGNGGTYIKVTSGTAGQNGNISVFANSPCGISGTKTLAVTSETPLDHSLYGCNACHITHNAPGGSLTNTFGNANLCLSCHVTNGAASGKPFTNANKAIPGTSGNSHSWDVPSVNETFETQLTSDPQMALRIDEANSDAIYCSTCHNQHNNGALGTPYLRADNTGNAICKDCHTPRNVGRYVDDNTNNRGSHPVGIAYPGTGDFETTPTGSAIVVGGNVECSSCHVTHYANTGNTIADSYLLRQPGDDALCTSCHTLMAGGGTPAGTHDGMTCYDCHQTHNTDKSNLYMIRNNIVTPNSGTRSVVFTALTGNGSFADNDADGNTTWDGICEVCHTKPESSNHHNFEPADPTDSNHYSGQNCTVCHPHSSNFSPSGGGCTSCHETNAPTYNSAVHVKHRDKYACATCHFGHGSGGANEGTHPSGTINVVFDLNGMATRNGLDSNTPDPWTGNTCGNIYCHSDGRSADRGSEGVADWGFSDSPVNNTYQTTPDWTTGSITACDACHGGPSTMPAAPNYTITEGSAQGRVNSTAEYPASGAHSSQGAHNSPGQLIDLTEVDGIYGTIISHSWPQVQCFWCHNNDAGKSTGEPKYQGTYGTSRHVDGLTWFYPSWYGYGGHGVKTSGGQPPDYYLMDTEAEIIGLGAGYVWHAESADPERRGSMIPGLGYSWSGPTNKHCGNGKNCW